MVLEPQHRDLIDAEALPTTRDLELYFTQPESPAHLMLGYFLAGEFVTHYTDAYSDAALVAALASIGDKTPTLDALADAAAVSEEQLDAGFKQYLEDRISALDNLEAFGKEMEAGLAAYAAKNWEEAEAAYQRARDLFPEYNANDGPLAALHQLYEATGDKEAQRKVIETMLSLDTANLAGWKRLADLCESIGDWEGVARAAQAAAAVDPFDLGMARQLFNAARQIEDHALALDAATRLAHIDPVDATAHRLAAVQSLMELGRRDEARRAVVRLLEDKPSFWKAQEVLLDLVESDKA
jgi:tetratricopeptide (TPR) repeat protein